MDLNKDITKEQESPHLFCGHCGVKNLASHNFCTDCGKPLKVISKVDDEHDYGKPGVKHKSVSWEPLRVVLLVITTIVFMISSFLLLGIVVGIFPLGNANFGTLTQVFASQMGITILPWLIILKITRSFRRKINRGADFLAGFLAMVSSWVWLGGYLVEVSFISRNPDVFWITIILSPVWFIIGLLVNFVVKPKEEESLNKNEKIGYSKDGSTNPREEEENNSESKSIEKFWEIILILLILSFFLYVYIVQT